MPNRDEVARFTTTKTVEDDETASLLAFQFCDFDQQFKIKKTLQRKNSHLLHFPRILLDFLSCKYRP